MQFDPFAPECLEDPYPYFKWMREYSPVYPVDTLKMSIITRYDDVEAALRNPEIFSSDGVTDAMQGPYNPAPDAPNMMGSDPPYHTGVRRIVSKAFTPRTVAALRPHIADIVDTSIRDALERGNDFDFATEVCLPIPLKTIMSLLGVDLAMHAQLVEWCDAIMDGINVAVSGEVVEPERDAGLRRNIAEFREFVLEIVAARRAEPRDDLISGLVHGTDDSGSSLSPGEQVSMVVNIINGGFESTSKFMATLLLVLLEHPEQHAALKADPSKVPAAVREALRYDGPAVFMVRRVTRDHEVAGTVLPEDSRCLVSFASANHDERRFSGDPEAFDLTRDWTGGMSDLAFGTGHHRCLGGVLAPTEAEVLLEDVLQRFTAIDWDPAGVERGSSFFVRGVTALPISVVTA